MTQTKVGVAYFSNSSTKCTRVKYQEITNGHKTNGKSPSVDTSHVDSLDLLGISYSTITYIIENSIDHAGKVYIDFVKIHI